MTSLESRQRGVVDEYLMSRGKAVELASGNFILALGPKADYGTLSEVMTISHLRRSLSPMEFIQDASWVEQQVGVLDLSMYEMLWSAFRKTSYFEDRGEVLSPLVKVGDSEREEVLYVPLRIVSGFTKHEWGIVRFEIPGIHDALNYVRDIHHAKRLGLLGHSTGKFSDKY